MKPVNIMPCNKGCGRKIYFDPSKRSVNDRPIPIDAVTHQPHQCKFEGVDKLKNEVEALKIRLADMETLVNSLHIKERLEVLEKRTEKLDN